MDSLFAKKNNQLMFRLDNYMEDWATRYKGILHTPDNPRFFRCNSEFTVDQFLQHYQENIHPVCGIVTHLEGKRDVTRQMDYPKYVCLFMGYAEAEDYKAQADVKVVCKQNADAFLAKLQHDKTQASRINRADPLSNIDLSSVQYDTIGPVTSSGWFILTVTINSPEYNKTCYTPADYIE